MDRGELHDLIGCWWWNYDEGNFDVLASLLSDDVHFTCRTDTGETEWEEFVRADVRGREPVMAWQVDHRINSPYPLRHNGTNVHVVDRAGERTAFSSYISVTHMVRGAPAPLSSGIVHGAVIDEGSALRISEMHVILDTADSDVFSKVRG